MCQILYVCNSWPLKWRGSTQAETACQGVTLNENAPCRSFNSTIDTDFIDISKMLSLKAEIYIFLAVRVWGAAPLFSQLDHC